MDPYNSEIDRSKPKSHLSLVPPFLYIIYAQVEYAIEAINNAGTCVGILAKDGIVMASERRITSGLLAPAKVSAAIIGPQFLMLVDCNAKVLILHASI